MNCKSYPKIEHFSQTRSRKRKRAPSVNESSFNADEDSDVNDCDSDDHVEDAQVRAKVA